MARDPAFSRVLYPTAQATDRLFIPSRGPEISEAEPYDGLNLNQTMANQLAQCQALIDEDTDGNEIGVAVQAGTLANW